MYRCASSRRAVLQSFPLVRIERLADASILVLFAIAVLWGGVAPLLAREPSGATALLCSLVLVGLLKAASLAPADGDVFLRAWKHSVVVVLWMFIAAVLQLAFLSQRQDELARLSGPYIFSSTAVAVLWFAVGTVVGATHLPRSSAAAVLLVALIAGAILSGLNGAVVVNFGLLSERAGFEISHLNVADFLLVALFVGYAVGGQRVRSLVFISCAPIMLSAGGRAAFVLGMFALSVVHWRHVSRAQTIGAVIAIAVVGSLVLSAVDVGDPLVQRMLFSGGLAEDTSLAERQVQFVSGLSHLPSQALFGDVRQVAAASGSFGGYIHNVLSAWQFFGAPGFLLIVWLCFSLGTRLLDVRERTRPEYLLALLLFIYAMGGMALARSALHFSVWLSLGMTAAVTAKPRRDGLLR